MARWRATEAVRSSADVRVLDEGDLAEALALCAEDPVASVLASSRLEVAQVHGLSVAAGEAWGFPASGPLEAVCWAGANLVPVIPPSRRAATARAVAAFAARARRTGRRCSSIVGEQRAVLDLWRDLSEVWPAPREVRGVQPSMAIDGDPAVVPDPLVRRSTPSDVAQVLPACVRMFTEEVGYSPLVGTGGAYEQRVRSLIAQGRSFVRMARDGALPLDGGAPDGVGAAAQAEVVFKAELGAVAGGVAQLQGVWVDPSLRGRGLSVPALSAVVALTRADVAPVVSLYVNDYNRRAVAAYRRVGFRQVGTFATVLF